MPRPSTSPTPCYDARSLSTVEVESKWGGADGRFEYVFVTMNRFPGRFMKAGTPLKISTETTENDILQLFGSPYWTDRSDGEVILFYEYRQGKVELQFEFWNGKTLSNLTLTLDGVLSVEEQRLAYGVTRRWPPEDGSDPTSQPEPSGEAAPDPVEDRDVSRRSWRPMPVWLHILLDTGRVFWWNRTLVGTPSNVLAI